MTKGAFGWNTVIKHCKFVVYRMTIMNNFERKLNFFGGRTIFFIQNSFHLISLNLLFQKRVQAGREWWVVLRFNPINLSVSWRDDARSGRGRGGDRLALAGGVFTRSAKSAERLKLVLYHIQKCHCLLFLHLAFVCFSFLVSAKLNDGSLLGAALEEQVIFLADRRHCDALWFHVAL